MRKIKEKKNILDKYLAKAFYVVSIHLLSTVYNFNKLARASRQVSQKSSKQASQPWIPNRTG
ncbi:hypothetical protein Phum_PHUM534900 [Pediculus humanus corporis]|uniref:Uncharacterized protein n=1 Tax=Pediculus humanus subsp. corporis TaxID=121224 RepID=E0VZJ1_PEDHC|nr:uncharacterized protein Phum_PHUM534900 [Pediculus humanus corporis]EEB18797.1 hypothetical protein Phum_PHUM534900 [Pediculus humanus corporis]